MENNNDQVDFEEIDLREYIGIILKRRSLIIGLLILAMLVGVILNLLIEPVYQSETIVKLSNSSGKYSNMNYAKQKIKNVNYIKEITKELNLSYNLDKLNKLRENNLEVDKLEDDVLAISFKSNDPQKAKQILSGIIDFFKQESLRNFERLKEEKLDYLEAINEEISKLEEDLKESNKAVTELKNLEMSVGDKAIISNNLNDRWSNMQEIKISLINKKQEIIAQINDMEGLEVINAPIVSKNPIRPNKLLNLAISILLGLLIGTFMAFFLEFLEI
jgi:uncharacterized protein involved in exopolysaccharide biosynthesis